MANITGIQKLALDVYNGATVMYDGGASRLER